MTSKNTTRLARLLALSICSMLLFVTTLSASAVSADKIAKYQLNTATIYPATIFSDEAAMVLVSGHRGEVELGTEDFEERYIAQDWSVNGGKATSFTETFEEDGVLYGFAFFEPEAPGTYTITVTYRRDVWLQNKWRAFVNAYTTRTVEVVVVDASKRPPTLADSDKNKISISDKVVTVGTKVYLSASGDQFDVETSRLGVGSTRYVPARWALSGYEGTFASGTMQAQVEPLRVGNYIYSVYFQKQEWNGKAWVNLVGKYDVKWLLFRVEKEDIA